MFSKVLRITAICALFFLVSCGPPRPDTQNYLLVFAEKGSSRIRVRFTGDRVNWQSAQFRDVTTNVGVGAGIEDSGFVKIVPWVTAGNNLEFAWGIAHAFDKSASDATSQVATSAPSVVAQPDSATWLIAFRTSGNRIAVRIFEPKDRRGFLDLDVAPLKNAFNDNVIGRPALTRLGNKVVMAWLRQDDSQPLQMRMTVGDIVVTADDIPIPSWTNKFAFDLPGTFGDTCYDRISISDPTLTHDFDKFYLAFTRRTRRCPGNLDGEDSLSYEKLFLYSSPDGVTWTPENPLVTRKTGTGIPTISYVNIAGWADGSIYVAIVGSGDFEVLQFENGTWTELNAGAIFDHTPEQQQFALVLGGHPAP